MSEYEVRNLRLAVIEDDSAKKLRAPYGLVDLMVFQPSDDPGIRTLEAHCRNAAAEKRVRFDLCSIDMNFQEDVDDPLRPASMEDQGGEGARASRIANPAIMTASGLYHGMGLLARRESTDEARNLLPLAWEVRSATPAAFGGRADLRNDAVRGYALLRSLLSKPAPGETLEACIQREYKAFRPGAEALQGTSLLEIVEADLYRQDPSSGLLPEILNKLLPRWRRLFREAIEQREILIHLPEMERQLTCLMEMVKEGRTSLSVTQPSVLCVPLRGPEAAAVGTGIRLVSIMADLVASGRIDVEAKTARLDDGAGPRSVLEWYRDMRDVARARASWRTLFRNTREQFERVICRTGLPAAGDLWRSCHGVHLENKRFFLYVLMRTRLWMTEADERRDPSDMGGDGEKETMSSIFGLGDANVHTYRRPARSNRVLATTPSALRADLREALEHGKGALLDHGLWQEWLAEELLAYCLDARDREGLGLALDDVRDLAPGLLRKT